MCLAIKIRNQEEDEGFFFVYLLCFMFIIWQALTFSLFWRLGCRMLMWYEVFVVLFLWRSQHEQLWKDYREYTGKDILSITKHSFSGVLLLLSEFGDFLLGEESPMVWSCPALLLPFLLWSHPNANAKFLLFLRNCGARLVTLCFQKQKWWLWDLLHQEEVSLGTALFSWVVLLCASEFPILLLLLFPPFFPFFLGGGYSFRFLIMYSAHTPGCQLNFIGPFKGQINLCFYKEKIKDQLSWPLMNICYWSLQSSYASLEETLPFAPSCLISWCIVAVT